MASCMDRKNMHGSYFSLSLCFVHNIYALKRDLIDDHGHAPPVTEATIAVMVLISLTAIQSMHRYACASRWKPPNDALTVPAHIAYASYADIIICNSHLSRHLLALVAAMGTVIQIKQAQFHPDVLAETYSSIYRSLTAPF
jgi:hypothetical protein